MCAWDTTVICAVFSLSERPVDRPSTARRAARRSADLVARSPGSFVYLLVLAVTIWLLSSLDSHTTDVLLRSVSTNVVEMSRSAPRVLVLSAFVVNALLLPAATGAARLAMPRTMSPRSWWTYVSSVAPRRTRRPRHRWMPVAAAAAVVVGVGFAALAHDSATNTADSVVSVPAEVVAIERSCPSGCPRSRLAYRYDDELREATVPLPARSTARVGATRLVQFRMDRPSSVTLGRNTESIDAGGFFSLAAIASFVAALLLVLGARRRWSSAGRVRLIAGTPLADAETGDASVEE